MTTVRDIFVSWRVFMEGSYEKDGWIYFNENCIVEQFVEVKWNSSNKSHYINLGYNCEDWHKPFQVDVRDLSNGSNARVYAICSLCGHRRGTKFCNITRSWHSKCFACNGVSDKTADIFTRLTVLKISGRNKYGGIKWLCRCECGNTCVVDGGSLQSGGTKSCGCLSIKDLQGIIYGRLRVREMIGQTKHGDAMWRCECECGNIKDVVSGSLQSGGTKSCGCLSSEIKRSRVGNKSSMWGRFGSDNPSYNHDLTDEERNKRRTKADMNWAIDIKEQDDYICQSCGKRGGDLESHHLNNYKDFPEQRLDLENGVTLCKSCHKEFHSWMGNNRVKTTFDDFVKFCEECHPYTLFLMS